MDGHSIPFQKFPGRARDRGPVTIDILSDDVLEIIFICYVNLSWGSSWHTLVHVCRRWRCLMFASPHRLKVRLEYLGHEPISEALGIWPVLPVILKSEDALTRKFPHPKSEQRLDNRLAALESEHYTRICGIYTKLPISRWERFAAAMQKPFPELTHLGLGISVDWGHVIPVVPDSFLGGSAPHLQHLALGGISFPSIQKLLLSANGLVTLILMDIPDSGYISPDAMATALAVMTRLETLDFRFRSPRSRPNLATRPLPPPTRFVLPAFNRFTFYGVYWYLEDLLARIDAPLLYDLHIQFSKDVNFDVPQLHRLIRHAGPFDKAHVLIEYHSVQLTFRPKSGVNHQRPIHLDIRCGELEWQLSSLTELCNSLSPLISTLKELEITEYRPIISSHSQDDTENARWLGLLHPFIALKNLYLTHGVAQRVSGALHDLSGERAFEVLPALRNLFVRGFGSLQPVENAMRLFVTARQLSGHPVAIDHWGSKEPRQHICYLPPRQTYCNLRSS